MVHWAYEPPVPSDGFRTIAFGMQCFWGAEGLLGATPGVIRTKVGYAGGKNPDPPAYRNLGDHTEAVEVQFDPTVISLEQLFGIFWANHDATVQQKKQYISAIYYYTDDEKDAALQSKQEVQKLSTKPIVTEIVHVNKFHNAEDYHQKYLLRQSGQLFASLKITDVEIITSHVAAKLNGYCGAYGSTTQLEQESMEWGMSDDQIQMLKEIFESGGVDVDCSI